MRRIMTGILILCILLLAGCGQKPNKDVEKQDDKPAVTTRKMVALTFDDGPNTTTMSEILNILAEYDVPATFFVIGANITEESGPVLQKAVEQGCEIGNHSQNHVHMEEMTADEIKAEIESVQESVEAYAGVRPTLFRPPYLTTSSAMFENIELTFISGYDSTDAQSGVSAEERASTVLAQAKDGAIFLMHCFAGNTKTADALYTIIPELQREGYELVTVSELLKEKGVKAEPHNGEMYYDAVLNP